MKTRMLRESRQKKIDVKLQNYECLGILLPCFSFLAIPLCVAVGALFLLSSGDADCFWTFMPLKSLAFVYFAFCVALVRTTLGICKKDINHFRKSKVILLISGIVIFLHLSIMTLLSWRKLSLCLYKEFSGYWIVWVSGPCF